MAGYILTLQLVAIVSGLVAALTLFYGSIGVPFHMQSYGGETPREKRWQLRQGIMKWIGIPAAFISAFCQLAAVLLAN
jgi:hypothetical protein